MADGGASDAGTPRDEPIPKDDAPSDEAPGEGSSIAAEMGGATATAAPIANLSGTLDAGDVVSEEPPLAPPSGSQIQRYVVVDKIGHGGMSVTAGGGVTGGVGVTARVAVTVELLAESVNRTLSP